MAPKGSGFPIESRTGTAETRSPRPRTQAGRAHRGGFLGFGKSRLGRRAHRCLTKGKAVSTHSVEPEHAADTHCQPPILRRLTQLLGLDRNNAASGTPMQLNTSNSRKFDPFPKEIQRNPQGPSMRSRSSFTSWYRLRRAQRSFSAGLRRFARHR
jgi:hypothetical protein